MWLKIESPGQRLGLLFASIVYQNTVKEYGMWWRDLSQMTITCNKIFELYDIRRWLCINLLVVYPGPESNRHACLGRGILSPLCLPIPPPGPNEVRTLNKELRIQKELRHSAFLIRYSIFNCQRGVGRIRTGE